LTGCSTSRNGLNIGLGQSHSKQTVVAFNGMELSAFDALAERFNGRARDFRGFGQQKQLVGHRRQVDWLVDRSTVTHPSWPDQG
jgi:hypothetical protein